MTHQEQITLLRDALKKITDLSPDDSSTDWNVELNNGRVALAASETSVATAAPEQDSDVSYELMQHDEIVASTCGTNALAEIMQYATQYEQDAPIEIFKVVRTFITD